MRVQTILMLSLTLAGFALRLYYLTTTHPFFDEYTTVLAARQILQLGLPRLPSGLFYEHGLLASYLIAPFTALFINLPLEVWQSAHWGLMLARWPSVLLSTATIPLIYSVGRRINNPWSAINDQFSPSNLPTFLSLLAAGLFALSPEGMVWGGRARMYALATLLVLLTVYWAYRGAVYPAPARYRWWAMLALLATLLTQFGAMTLVPPLVVAMVVVGRLSFKEAKRRRNEEARKQESEEMIDERGSVKNIHHPAERSLPLERTTHHAPRIWFLRPIIILEVLALAVVVGIAVWVKRLGQPLGMAALGSEETGALPRTLLETVTYQTAFSFSWPAVLDFLAEQFGPPHLFWLALATVLATAIGMIIWLINQWRISPLIKHPSRSSPPRLAFSTLFLWLIFGLILLEMVTVLDPFRQNPRYLVMYLPLFYLIAAQAILDFGFWISLARPWRNFRFHASRFFPTVVALALLVIFTVLSLPDLRIALVTPEPSYEAAFKVVHENWQPGDALLTMNTPAAALYQSQVDGFTVQADADQFLLNKDSVPVDRWTGASWVGTAADFNAALNTHERVWFVLDTIRLPVYFRGDWQAVLNSQMEQVWSQDNALVFRTRPDRMPLPEQPETLIKATLGNAIELMGYTLQISAPDLMTVTSNSSHFALTLPLSALNVTLFWRPSSAVTTDYTIFLHLRNHAGATVAQQDSLPLAGVYPTSRWQPGETVIDPLTLSLPADLPPGQYTLWAGMYQLDTLARLPVANDTSGENAILLGEINYQ
ncbi:MAG: hypothetical protein BroJett011_29880 [Chloroflexota bacterium]|nr:MAG: hypothetical protein BroJett011_29880 [Chloroflexota bacterium]